MKKYIALGLVLLNTLGLLSASTWHSAEVTITYEYTKDYESMVAGLIPQRLRPHLNQTQQLTNSNYAVYCVTFNVSFYSNHPTSSVDHIKETVIDKLGLNEFAALRIFNNQEELTTPEIAINSLQNANLNIFYDRDDNTSEKIQTRRINWVIEKITGIPASRAWDRRVDREIIRNALAANYFDEQGNPKRLNELEKIGRVALHGREGY